MPSATRIAKKHNLYSPEEINEILKRLNLVPEISPKVFVKKTKGIKHRYYSPCIQGQKKRFFYCLLQKSPKSRHKFLHEIRFARFFLGNHLQEIPSFLPSYLATSKLTEDPPWILLDWITSPVLENKREAELSIHQLTRAEAEKLSKITIKINDFLSFPKFQKHTKPTKFNLKLAWKKITQKLAELEKKKEISRKTKQLLYSRLAKDFQIWEKENRYFCHGDLHLGNIVYWKKAEVKFKIIDWELYHINNFAYDISFFFSRLWREPKIRNRLITTYLSLLPKTKVNLFKRLFKVNLLYFALSYGIDSAPLEFTKSQIKERQTWFKKFIELYLQDFSNYLRR